NAGAGGLEGAAARDAARQRDRRADDAAPPQGRRRGQRPAHPHGARRGVRAAGGRAVIRWWARAPIRVRLTVWYTVVLSLMLIAYATATFVAVRHEFFEQLDDQVHDDFEIAEGSLARTP